MKKLFCLLIIGFFLMPAYSTHLAGGTIRVICVGGNQFKIQLIKYRDPQGAAAMAPGDITIQGTSTVSYSTTIKSHNLQLPQPNNNACWALPAASYLEEFVYETAVIELDSGTSYYLYHMDNARNSTNTIPFQATMVLYTEFGDPAIVGCNNSPVFNEHPPMATCLNQSLQYDGSATDPDGDTLEYWFCDALTGTSFPFPPAQYSGGYSGSYPVSSSPPLSIDVKTGLITGTPNFIGGYGGRWTLNYCVDEYRGGVKIGQYNREVQMTVTACNNPVAANVGSSYTSIALGIDVVASCDDFTVKFKNTSNGGASFFWDFGVAGIDTDTSSQFEPTYTYPDTGVFQVMLIVNPGDTCADSVTKTVLIYPGMSADFSYATPVCKSQSVAFMDQSTGSHGDPIYWSWQFGDGGSSGNQNPVYTYQGGGSYNTRLILEDSKGCRDTVTKQVQVDSIGLDLGPDTAICGTQHVLDAGTPALNVLWSTGAQTQQITVTSSGTYSVTVSDGICTEADTIDVTLDPVPMTSLDSMVNLCQGDTIYPQISSTGATFQWDPGIGVVCDTCLLTGLHPPQTTTYTLTASNGAGCEVSDTIRVEVDGSGTAEISGSIQTSQSQPYQNGKVLLIEYNPLDSTVTAVDSILTDGQGGFTFFTGQQQVYIKATPDSATYPNEIPTYYESGLVWDSADAITVQPCDSLFLSFSTIGGTNPGGPGFIAGNVFQGAGKMLDRSDPIVGLTLILIDEAGNPVALTTTDQQGHYYFADLALGRYAIWGDKPFMRNNAAPEVELTSIDPTIDSLWIKYYDRQLFFDVTSLPPMEGIPGWKIYPNPASTVLYLERRGQTDGEIKISMVNALGQRVLQKVIAGPLSQLDISKMEVGLYFIQVQQSGGMHVYPIVINH